MIGEFSKLPQSAGLSGRRVSANRNRKVCMGQLRMVLFSQPPGETKAIGSARVWMRYLTGSALYALFVGVYLLAGSCSVPTPIPVPTPTPPTSTSTSTPPTSTPPTPTTTTPAPTEVEPFVPDYPLNRYESQIRVYEKRDSIAPPTKGRTLFVGSSSISNWKTLDADLAPLPVLNRGFGGSTTPELIHYCNRIILPYEPKIVMIYAGENDFGSAKPITPAQVALAYKELVTIIQKRLATSRIGFISIKPSPNRWSRWPRMQETNRLIQQYIQTDKRLFYVDVSQAMLGPNGRPKPELFLADSLHMTPKGYKIWTDIIKPVVQQMAAK